jgi:hypothetical protein
MGREWGIDNFSPPWSLRSKTPASRRAAAEKGGVLTSPRNHMSGLSSRAMRGIYVARDICQRRHVRLIGAGAHVI